MALSGSLFLYPVFLVVSIAVLLALQGITRNSFIRRKTRFSLLLLIAALLYELGQRYYDGTGEAAAQISLILTALAVITTLAALLFNPFKEEKISDTYPRIVQDAVVIGAFVLIATYIAPERLFATSAIGGLVLGLALQDTLGNLFAGLAIQVEKPFRVGDWVKAGGYEGRVAEVTWRATRIRTKSGMFVIIPNSLVSKDTLVNYSQPSPVQRLQFQVGLDYEAAPNTVKQILLETCSTVPEILTDPPPTVLLTGYADFAINYSCRFWINDFANSDVILDRFSTLLYYRLRRAGLKVPFPIRDLRLTTQQPMDETVAEEQRIDYVEKVELFRGLGPADKEGIMRAMEPLTFAANEVIIRQSDAGDSMFFIRRGRVRVVLESESGTHEVARLGDGDYFGEMALLTGEPRTATIVADTDVDAYVLVKERFRPVLEDNPKIIEDISLIAARRKQELDKEASQIAARLAPVQREEQQNLLARIQRFFGLGT